jgi:hypothetical protein
MDDVGPAAPAGTLWMQSTGDSLWYAVNLSGTSGSNNLAISVNQTPLTWVSPGGQDFPYQLLQCTDGNVYQVYLSGTAGSVAFNVNPTPAPPNPLDYKPYLLMQSLTDGNFYTVSLTAGPTVTINPNSILNLNNISLSG